MFNHVEQFEKEIAAYFGSTYAVATDCCTHAIELSLRYTNAKKIEVPKHTYISIPFTAKKLNIDFDWCELAWQNYYYVTNNVVDAAVLWRKNSYIPETYMCLSFQFKKHLSLGRGGAILCDNKEAYASLKKMSYDGRNPDTPWSEQNITSIGYHYYMTPETAKLGLEKLGNAIARPAKKWSWADYPDLSVMTVFNN